MKLCRRIMVLFMCVAVLCGGLIKPSHAIDYESTEYGCYGIGNNTVSYPLCSRFMSCFRSYDGFDEWYRSEYCSYTCRYTPLEYLSSVWCDYYRFGDKEIWCDEYLDRFDSILANADKDKQPLVTDYGTQLYEYSVDEYFWDGRTLKLKCSADFDITYRCYFSSLFDDYNVDVFGCIYPVVYIAVTDKSDGSLVNMGYVKDSAVLPDLKYGTSGSSYNPEYIHEELLALMDTGETINYTCTSTKIIDVQMPEFFNPDEHGLTVYFRTLNYDYNDVCVYERDFCNPVTIKTEGFGTKFVYGDASGDGELNLDDVSLTMKFIARWDGITVDETAADVNLDGRIGLIDVCLMLKLIAGWDIGTSFK